MKKLLFVENNAGYGIATIDTDGVIRYISNASVYALIDAHTTDEKIDYAGILNDVEDDSSWDIIETLDGETMLCETETDRL